jgi:hypothetical protein
VSPTVLNREQHAAEACGLPFMTGRDRPPGWPGPLRSTNPIESLIEICREHSKNAKRWRDETMALRWCDAGMLEADHQFRGINDHLQLPKLRAALEVEVVGGGPSWPRAGGDLGGVGWHVADVTGGKGVALGGVEVTGR